MNTSKNHLEYLMREVTPLTVQDCRTDIFSLIKVSNGLK